MPRTRRSLKTKTEIKHKMTNLEGSSGLSTESIEVIPRRSARLAAKKKKIAEETGDIVKEKTKSSKTKKISKAKKKVTRTYKARTTKKAKKNLKIRNKKEKFNSSEDEDSVDSLDLALICDCTGSMSSWMTRAKETLRSIICLLYTSPSPRD